MLLSEHVYCVAVTFTMTEQVEQQICIKFCIKLEYFSMETIWMIQKPFGDDAVSAAQIKVAQMLLKDGRDSVESVQQAVHLRMLNMYGLQSAKISD